MKRLSFLLFASLLALWVSAPATAATYSPDNYEVQSTYAYLYNIDTDQVMYEKNATERCYPASTTKIMTAILAIEYVQDNGLSLDTEMITYPDYVQDELYRYRVTYGEVSLAGLIAGEQLTMREALYGMMLRSGNEVAMSVADHIAGSQEAFAELMTRRAHELGATNTNFVNANGLYDDNHYTTAHDMAIIALHAISLPDFLDISSTPAFTAGPTNVHDELPWVSTFSVISDANYESYYMPNVRGIKTGTLDESGRCFVSVAEQGGLTYLLVLMGAPYRDADDNEIQPNTVFVDTKNIYAWVFDAFRYKAIVEQGVLVTQIDVRLSMDQDVLRLMTADRFTMLVLDDIDLESVLFTYDLPDAVDAPIERGDKIGTATMMLSGVEVGTVDLLASESISASTLLVLFEKAKGVLGSFWFKFGVVFVVLVVLAYVIIMIIRNRRRKRFAGYTPRRRI